jgi:hypothetical protein
MFPEPQLTGRCSEPAGQNGFSRFNPVGVYVGLAIALVTVVGGSAVAGVKFALSRRRP